MWSKTLWKICVSTSKLQDAIAVVTDAELQWEELELQAGIRVTGEAGGVQEIKPAHTITTLKPSTTAWT